MSIIRSIVALALCSVVGFGLVMPVSAETSHLEQRKPKPAPSSCQANGGKLYPDGLCLPPSSWKEIKGCYYCCASLTGDPATRCPLVF